MDNVAAYEAFIEKHGTSEYAKEASRRVESLKWADACSINTRLSYEKYLAAYPVGSFTKEAQTALSELKATLGRELVGAAREGDVEDAKQLLADGADPNGQDDEGNTPLNFASNSGDLDMITLLLAEGADVNAAPNHGFTSLHVAAQFGHEDAVQLLIDSGANPAPRDANGDSPLHIAAGKSGNGRIVNILIANGCGVNTKNKVGATPLDFAAQEGNTEMAELLIEKGATLSGTRHDGSPPLYTASQNGNVGMVQLLISEGAEVNQLCRKNRETALIRAAIKGHREVVEILLGSGADGNIRDKHGMTALHAAAQLGHLEIARLLLSYNACSNLKGSDRKIKTPLHLAAFRGDVPIVELFIANGADVDAKQEEGATPLHLAAQEGHLSIVKLLVAAHANINVKARGITPMQLARDSAHSSVVRYLEDRGGR